MDSARKWPNFGRRWNVYVVDIWELYVQWSMRFPVEEEVKGLGIGNGWAAAATSQHLLRVYSEAGLQVHMFWIYILLLQLNLQFCFSAAK